MYYSYYPNTNYCSNGKCYSTNNSNYTNDRLILGPGPGGFLLPFSLGFLTAPLVFPQRPPYYGPRPPYYGPGYGPGPRPYY